ncbi:MAG: peptidyl-prolyl cis-trans isomerase [Myxococcota bacterium]|nr:peptidyl-prolyl cis-trans isomerase [Myxococcota bacterium]
MWQQTLGVGCLCLVACTDADPHLRSAPLPSSQAVPASLDSVVARVNGTAITAADIRSLNEFLKADMTHRESLDVLIRSELLAQEARRRGYGAWSAVEDTRRIELARALLKTRIAKGVRTGTLDEDKLRTLYKENQERFVHGILRRVSHILVPIGKNAFSEEEASAIASEIAKAAGQTTTLEAFVALGRSFEKAHPTKITVEDLPPFAEDNKRFVKPFVEGTFAIPKVGGVSPPVKTTFGWHVIFVSEELPAANRPFEAVRQELAEQVLPFEKQRSAGELMDVLLKRNEVFIFDAALDFKEVQR